MYVGDLTDILEAYWSVRMNGRMHNFWAFRQFISRLADTAKEFGIVVDV